MTDYYDADRPGYLASLADELAAQATRVRNLIGGRHWLSDGHHKEHLLGSVIRRHVAAAILVGRGFVVSPTNPEQCSSEQDLLVLDCAREAPIFNQGGLLIAFPDQVLAAISVKTRLGPTEVRDGVKGLSSVLTLANLCCKDPAVCWAGVFCFEVTNEVARSPQKPYGYLRAAIKAHPVQRNPLGGNPQAVGPNLLCSSRDYVYKVVPSAEVDDSPRIVGLSCGGLATAVFLANLLDHVAQCRGEGRSNVANFVEHPSIQKL